ncbi:MAG: hypothetical protein H6711_10250 [Myxococcales bacterium]|nr:hypothetical protein [Myxococcales bacterium]
MPSTRVTLALAALLATSLGGSACGAVTGEASGSEASGDEGSESASDSDGDTNMGVDTDDTTDPEPAPRRCVAPPGLGAPQTIAEALALLGALPEPVDVACVVESLDRPLAIQAITSKFSAQPANDPKSPRIFLFLGGLTLSIVLDGPGQGLLEFGERVGETESLKGELIMPVALPIPEHKPFEHLRYDEVLTTCGICHRGERPSPTIDHPNAIISRALRPSDELEVTIDDLLVAQASCDVGAEATRCALLDALLSHGPVEEGAFPATYSTIYDP